MREAPKKKEPDGSLLLTQGVAVEGFGQGLITFHIILNNFC